MAGDIAGATKITKKSGHEGHEDHEGSVRIDEGNDAATQVNRGTWYISAPDKPDAWVVPVVLRSIFPQELPLLVSAAGLELVSRFGDLSRAPFGRGSRSQICLCRRRA